MELVLLVGSLVAILGAAELFTNGIEWFGHKLDLAEGAVGSVPGAMLSFEHAGGEEAARRFAGATRLFTLAESLGAVESLIELPAPMTHASVADSPLAVPGALVRLSVGIENVDDLRADLEAAFGASA
jgi:cystathionine beta-lyase/cystathionine gamma-synthase